MTPPGRLSGRRSGRERVQQRAPVRALGPRVGRVPHVDPETADIVDEGVGTLRVDVDDHVGTPKCGIEQCGVHRRVGGCADAEGSGERPRSLGDGERERAAVGDELRELRIGPERDRDAVRVGSDLGSVVLDCGLASAWRSRMWRRGP